MNRLKVLLIRPNSEADELIPPFGLGYLASMVREKHDIKILDCLKEKLTSENLEKYLLGNYFDVIGIQVFTCHIDTVKEYINSIKKILPRVFIILGGPHPSADPKNIFSFFLSADFGFKGEAEIGFPKILDFLARAKSSAYFLGSDYNELRQIPGLIWKKVNEVLINPQIFTEDLDSLKFPAWDLINPDSYPLAPHGAFFKNYPIAPIIITRGCPYSCTYCAGHLISGRKIRKRSAGNVLEEIKLLHSKYGIREIHIEDDNFTFYPELVKEFCEKLIESGLNISWTCPNGVRLDTLNKDLLDIMKSAGLYSVSLGVESGSEKILRDMKKSLTKEKIIEKLCLIKESGLKSIGFFIIGYPAETKNDILETISFAKKLPLTRATFSIFKPFPGTEATENIAKKGEVDFQKTDFTKFVLNDVVYSPPGITIKELKNLRRRAFLEFYLRPKIIFSMAGEIKNFSHFKIVMKRIFRWMLK